MIEKERKGLRVKAFDYNSESSYFITLCTQDRKCVLSQIVGTGVPDCPCVQLLPYGKTADKYIKQLNDFYDNITVDNYVIMPNHIHLMLTINGQSGTRNGQSRTPVPTVSMGVAPNVNSTVAKFVSTFKRFCNKEYGYNIWQTRYYDHIIRNFNDYKEHLTYISNNPLSWHLDKLYTQ